MIQLHKQVRYSNDNKKHVMYLETFVDNNFRFFFHHTECDIQSEMKMGLQQEEKFLSKLKIPIFFDFEFF